MTDAAWPSGRVMLIVLVAALLGGLILLLEAGATQPMDAAVNLGFAPYRGPWLIELFLWITMLGSDAGLWAMMAGLSLYLWARGQTRLLVPLWVTFIGTEVTTWGLKFILARPRPDFLPNVASAVSPSFPSAHSAGSMAVLGFAAYAIAPDRFGVRVWMVVAIGMIGVSRLFLNVHYLTDVLGGYLIGLFWILLVDRQTNGVMRV